MLKLCDFRILFLVFYEIFWVIFQFFLKKEICFKKLESHERVTLVTDSKLMTLKQIKSEYQNIFVTSNF